MKLILVFCACLALVAAEWKPRTKEEYYKYREECFKEENVSAEAIEKIKNHQYSDEPEALCYIRCIGKKSGTWDDYKGYDIDRVYETFKAADMEVAKEDMKKCFHQLMDASACVWAAYNMRCLWDNKYITKKTKA